MLYPIELHSEILARTSGFEPASRFRPTVFKTASSPAWTYGRIFGASHGTRTRTRKSELPPQDSVSTKFHQERIFYFEIGSRWTQTIVSLTVIEVVSPQCCLTTCFQWPLRDSNPALRAWKARVLNHLDQGAILVGVTGVEPAWIFIQRLLRPLCIPVSAHAESYNAFYIIYDTPNEC